MDLVPCLLQTGSHQSYRQPSTSLQPQSPAPGLMECHELTVPGLLGTSYIKMDIFLPKKTQGWASDPDFFQ